MNTILIFICLVIFILCACSHDNDKPYRVIFNGKTIYLSEDDYYHRFLLIPNPHKGEPDPKLEVIRPYRQPEDSLD